MALFVEMRIIGAWFNSAFARGNHRFCLERSNGLAKGIRIIALVGDDIMELESVNQFFRLRQIMPLATSQKKAQGIAKGVDQNMDFCTEATPTAA